MMKCLAGRHIHFDLYRLINRCLVLKFHHDHQVNNSIVAHDTFSKSNAWGQDEHDLAYALAAAQAKGANDPDSFKHCVLLASRGLQKQH